MIYKKRENFCAYGDFHASVMWDGEGKSRRAVGNIVFGSVCVCVAKSSAEVHLTGWEGNQDPQRPANIRVSQPVLHFYTERSVNGLQHDNTLWDMQTGQEPNLILCYRLLI